MSKTLVKSTEIDIDIWEDQFLAEWIVTPVIHLVFLP